MNARLLIIIAAGAGCGFFLPLPEAQVPTARKPARADTREAPLTSTQAKEEPEDWPHDGSEIASLSVTDCTAALRRLLHRFATSPPPPEHQRIAIALLVRLLSAGSGAEMPAILKSERLPAWLLASAWLDMAKSPQGIPESFRRQLPLMPAGLDAARRIAESLAVDETAKARAFTNDMPGDWRRDLREALLRGMAISEPLKAARESGTSERFQTQLAHVAARRGPMDQAVRMIEEFVDSDFTPTIESLLSQLHARDPEKTRQLVEATGDEKLSKALAGIAARTPDEPENAVSPTILLSAPEGVATARLEEAARTFALTALQDPAAAKSAWAALPDGKWKEAAAVHLAATLAEKDPTGGLLWAEENSPLSSVFAFRVHAGADLPGALRAALSLPESSMLRANVIKDAKQEQSFMSVAGVTGRQEDLLAAVSGLPENLQRLLRREPVSPSKK